MAMTRAKKLDHIQSGVPSHSTNKNERFKDSPLSALVVGEEVRHRKSAEALARGARTSGLHRK